MMTSITNKYSDPVHFNNLLTEIGLNNTQIARLESDGFTTMEVSVSYYQTDVHYILRSTFVTLTRHSKMLS